MKIGDLVRYRNSDFLKGLVGIVVENPHVAGSWSKFSPLSGAPRTAVRICWVTPKKYEVQVEMHEWVDQLEIMV